MADSPARAGAVCTAAAARSLTTTAAAAAGATTEAPGAPAEQHGARGTTLFSQQAALYAQHRPDYPPALYDAVLSFAAPNRRQLALDVATGTGQVAAELAQHFERVLAVDSAQAQLDHAARRPNIAYQLAPAERLEGVQSGSMDLLTVAQAFHWWGGGFGWLGGWWGLGVCACSRCVCCVPASLPHEQPCPCRRHTWLAFPHPSPAVPTCLCTAWAASLLHRLARFDFPAFLAEARRVLRPDSTLAIWGAPSMCCCSTDQRLSCAAAALTSASHICTDNFAVVAVAAAAVQRFVSRATATCLTTLPSY